MAFKGQGGFFWRRRLRYSSAVIVTKSVMFSTLKDCSFVDLVGAVALSYVALKAIFLVIKWIRMFALPPAVTLSKLGQWAVVTGASDGIGKAFAERLASQSFNIVLVSRTLSKLQDLADSIRKNHGVQTKVIAVDMSKENIYPGIEKNLEGLDIGILINNVGIGPDHPEYFCEVEDTETTYGNMIRCNLMPMTFMSTIVLPGMLSRKRGAIINVGSLSFIGTPLMAVYSATKAYVNTLTTNLVSEYKNSGVVFQALHPGLVATKLSKIRKTSLLIPSPVTYVTSALGTLGKTTQTTGYFFHEIQLWASGVLPKSMQDSLAMLAMLPVRNKALKKKMG